MVKLVKKKPLISNTKKIRPALVHKKNTSIVKSNTSAQKKIKEGKFEAPTETTCVNSKNSGVEKSDTLLDKEKVLKVVESLLEIRAKKLEDKKDLFSDVPEDISLQINCIKTPETPTRFLRIPLPHSIVPESADICIFVCDAKKRDIEGSIEFYKDVFEKSGVQNIKEIIPIRKLREDYNQFELKRKLCCQFDKFLSEGKISSRILPLLGKSFYSRKMLPTPVSLTRGDIKQSIDLALKKSLIHLTGHGTSVSCKVAHTDMSPLEICENIIEMTSGLNKEFPGGWKNIRSLIIMSPNSERIPIYLSLISPNEVPVPIVENRRTKIKPVKGELSTIPGATVTVYPSGVVRVRKRRGGDDDDNDGDDDTKAPESKKGKRNIEGLEADEEDDMIEEYNFEVNESSEESEDSGAPEEEKETTASFPDSEEENEDGDDDKEGSDSSSDEDVNAAEDNYLKELEEEKEKQRKKVKVAAPKKEILRLPSRGQKVNQNVKKNETKEVVKTKGAKNDIAKNMVVEKTVTKSKSAKKNVDKNLAAKKTVPSKKTPTKRKAKQK